MEVAIRKPTDTARPKRRRRLKRRKIAVPRGERPYRWSTAIEPAVTALVEAVKDAREKTMKRVGPCELDRLNELQQQVADIARSIRDLRETALERDRDARR